MIEIAVTADEHISTGAFFAQFPNSVARFHVYPGTIRGRNNFASFPGRFLRRNRIDLIHVKNYTVLNRVNWVVEHEHGYSLLPMSRKRIRTLTSRHCSKVIFMSRYARWTAASLLNEVGDSVGDEVLKKSTVIYPAVSRRTVGHDYDRDGPLNICFVGNEFIRKGGLSVWEVFNRLSSGYDIRLTLISNFRMPPVFRRKTLPGYPDYSVFQDRLDALMKTCSDRVNILEGVTRDEVLDTHLPQADIFVTPTFADSFGIANLEAMAQGLPIITTNINAIPEVIEDGVHGLLIDNSMGDSPLVDGALHMKHSWRQLGEDPLKYLGHVSTRLEANLLKLIENPSLRRTLGVNAKMRFERDFSMEVRNGRYEKLYREAVAS